MPDASHELDRWIESDVPLTDDEIVEWLTVPTGGFRSDEGINWDFKDEWPFSLSDRYFGGIARLICAFSNTIGGIIVFGVHDTKRTGNHNKVTINFDRFTKAVSQLLSSTPRMRVISYDTTKTGRIDVLYIAPREISQPPLRFRKEIENYKANEIWIRRGFEVSTALPSDYPVLFCRSYAPIEADTTQSIEGSLPPSPATLRRFVGRLQVMDELFGWLERNDEPRNYLHGKGGSGKTTIAYEFGRLLKDFGQRIKINGSDPIDSVIFLSAKEKSLDTTSGEIVNDNIPDFHDEKTLLTAILYFGGWTKDKLYLDGLSIDSIRSEIRSFFDITSCVIILDDIDTLTTKNIDPGSDNIYRTLCRSKRSSKILYTIRNAPTQSLLNSIEVPGLSEGEFEEFVSECAKHFRVPAPPDAFREKTLADISERRPLIIESVVALVRTAGNYSRAIELFEQHAGDDARSYVFSREWDALRTDHLSRLLLAGLSDLNEPSSFGDLQTVLQADPSRIRDAIGAVREMFLAYPVDSHTH